MPDERNYWCICDDNCKFPTMTYEQILEAIAEATGNLPEHVEDAFITKIKESNNNANLTFWKGTQAEFNALGVTAPVYKVGIDSGGKLYFIPYSADDLTAHASRHASGGDDAIDPDDIGALPVGGGTMGGNIDMNGNTVTGLATPTSDDDAATKQYVDEHQSTDANSDIIFYFGDGLQDASNPTVHDSGYQYFDTGNTLDIALDKYMLEMDFSGVGAVANETDSAFVFLCYLNSGYFSLSFKNDFQIIQASEAVLCGANIKIYFDDVTIIRRISHNDNEQKTSTETQENTGIQEKSIKRILVQSGHSGNVLCNGILRFVRIKDRD